jgi:hypothetical protein
MTNIHLVPVSDLPESLFRDALDTVSTYSVSLVIRGDRPDLQQPCAGVLVNYDGIRGILTARHVSERLRAGTVLALLVAHRQILVPVALLRPKHPTPIDSENCWEAALPDLSFIALPITEIEILEASGKAFYGIARRLHSDVFDVYGEDGFFLAIGSPAEMVKREAGQLVQLRFATDVAARMTVHGWDYVVVNLDLKYNPAIPETLKGMSGGGLWRVKIKVDDLGVYSIQDPLADITLNGVFCLQTNTEDRQLVAHGPSSVYSMLRDFLRN